MSEQNETQKSGNNMEKYQLMAKEVAGMGWKLVSDVAKAAQKSVGEIVDDYKTKHSDQAGKSDNDMKN